MMDNFIPEELYNTIFATVPRICVDLVIRDKDGGVLLTLRNIDPHKGIWHLPGGGIKFKETITEAADRIARKELGVEVKVLKTLGVCEMVNDDWSGEKLRHTISAVVEAHIVGDSPPQETAETAAVQYFQKLPEAIYPYHEQFLREHGLLP